MAAVFKVGQRAAGSFARYNKVVGMGEKSHQSNPPDNRAMKKRQESAFQCLVRKTGQNARRSKTSLLWMDEKTGPE